MSHWFIVSSFNIEPLANALKAKAAPTAAWCSSEVAVAPYGQVVPTLSGENAFRPTNESLSLVWTLPEQVVPGFGRLMRGCVVGEQEIMEEVDQFAERVGQFSQRCRAVFVPSWVRPIRAPHLGLLDCRSGGITHTINQMNLRVAAALAPYPGCFVLPTESWTIGLDEAQPSSLWYSGKLPFHLRVFQRAAIDLQQMAQALVGRSRKLLVLDLDDTLWGGIVGEIGWQNLRLGGHDPVGEAFVEFQQGLKCLQRRGVLLAIASKNDESVALAAIKRHPEMVLQPDDFVAWRIHWRDKAASLVELAEELNLGLDSLAFIDDQESERERVRDALPEVLVPDWSGGPLNAAKRLADLRCFDRSELSSEDRRRHELYVAEGKRKASQGTLPSWDDWLASLQMQLSPRLLADDSISRAVQLLNKTNQMNLTTRRMTQTELADWVASDKHHAWCFSLTDQFGEAGLCGFVSCELSSKTLKVVDFVLSCRVFGRHVEHAMMAHLIDFARQRGCGDVVAQRIGTGRNGVCRDFLVEARFDEVEPDRFRWPTENMFAWPSHIAV